MNPAHILIPARYASTRFPGKPLADLGGRSVISRVVDAALRSRAARPVYVATDDERIAGEIEAHFLPDQARAVSTSPLCHTGTDRLAEAVRALGVSLEPRTVIVNVQGDEPFLDPAHIDALLDVMNGDPALQMATLATPFEGDIHDPNVVKVVVSKQSRALYFSRAPIPFHRDGGEGAVPLRHLGIYAYDTRWLLEMAALAPSPLEEIEKLEQLRALEHVVPIAIDTPADLDQGREFLQRNPSHTRINREAE